MKSLSSYASVPSSWFFVSFPPPSKVLEAAIFAVVKPKPESFELVVWEEEGELRVNAEAAMVVVENEH